jgi:hypothetical protein
MGHAASSSGQPVGFIQLTEEEALEMKKIPVMILVHAPVLKITCEASNTCPPTRLTPTTRDPARRRENPSVQADLSGMNGYHNPKGGWADAAGSIQKLASKCTVVKVV